MKLYKATYEIDVECIRTLSQYILAPDFPTASKLAVDNKKLIWSGTPTGGDVASALSKIELMAPAVIQE
jgi:hypothetical protein